MPSLFLAGLAGAARGLERVGEGDRELEREMSKYKAQTDYNTKVASEKQKLKADSETKHNEGLSDIMGEVFDGSLSIDDASRQFGSAGGTSSDFKSRINTHAEFNADFAADVFSKRVASFGKLDDVTPEQGAILASGGNLSGVSDPFAASKAFKGKVQANLLNAVELRQTTEDTIKMIHDDPSILGTMAEIEKTLGNLASQTTITDFISRNVLGISEKRRADLQRFNTNRALLTQPGAKAVIKEDKLSDTERKNSLQVFEIMDTLTTNAPVAIAALMQFNKWLGRGAVNLNSALDADDFKNRVEATFSEIGADREANQGFGSSPEDAVKQPEIVDGKNMTKEQVKEAIADGKVVQVGNELWGAQ